MALPELLANSATPGSVVALTTLGADMTTTSGLTFTMAAAAPAALQGSGQFRAVVDSEIVIFDAANVSTTTWTALTRGAESSTAATHSTGASVFHYLTAGGLEVVSYGGWANWMPSGAKAETLLGHILSSPASAGGGGYSGYIVVGALGVPLLAGETYTSITFLSAGGAASAPTNQWFTIIDLATLKTLRTTVDDTTTAWAANTLKTLSLFSPYTPTANHTVYLGCCVVATTPPTLAGTNVLGSGAGSGINNVTPGLAGRDTSNAHTTPIADGTAVTLLVSNGSPLPYAYLS